MDGVRPMIRRGRKKKWKENTSQHEKLKLNDNITTVHSHIFEFYVTLLAPNTSRTLPTFYFCFGTHDHPYTAI